MIRTPNPEFRVWDAAEQAFRPFFTDPFFAPEDFMENEDLEGQPRFTIQQWTGTLSVDGKKIFDGDLVLSSPGTPYRVFWHVSGWQWYEIGCYLDNGMHRLAGNVFQNAYEGIR